MQSSVATATPPDEQDIVAPFADASQLANKLKGTTFPVPVSVRERGGSLSVAR